MTLTEANGATLGATPTQTVTILDDDPAPTLAIGDVTVSEGAGPATFTVTLSTASGQLVSVGYTTANATAVAGSDYTATSGVLTVEAGVVSQPIVVPLVTDTGVEATETFVVTLTNGVNVTLADAQAVSTILDDDQPLCSRTTRCRRGSRCGRCTSPSCELRSTGCGGPTACRRWPGRTRC